MSTLFDHRTASASGVVNPYVRSNTTYYSMNDWMAMAHPRGRTARKTNTPVIGNENWRKIHRPATFLACQEKSEPTQREDNFYRAYDRLIQNMAYKFPNPGPPRTRQGAIGGQWRHVKEVLGHGGSRVIFIDGVIKQHDTECRNGDPPSWNLHRRATPLYAASRHDVSSYRRGIQQQMARRSYHPAYVTEEQLHSMYPIPGETRTLPSIHDQRR